MLPWNKIAEYTRRNALCGGIATGLVTASTIQNLTAQEKVNAGNAGVFVNVKDFGAVGDGNADDTAGIQAAIDHCFGEATVPHSGPKAFLNIPLYFPPGTYNTTAPLLLTNVRGGHIFGAGRFATTIRNVAGTSVLRTNGFEFSRIEMLRLSATGNVADVLDLDWTNGGGTALQSNTFADMCFGGGGIGVNIGKSGFMGSENLFLNCYFGAVAISGVRTSNFNALQNTLLGGNIQSCPIGVWVHSGSCSVYNTGFQICDFDIVVNNSANDTMVISGCRSESLNFIQLRNGVTVYVVGCLHSSSKNGVFADIAGCQVVIESSVSSRGIIKGFGLIRTTNTSFGRRDWIDFESMRWGLIDVQNCYVGGTKNTGFDEARLIHRKVIIPTGIQWPSQRMSLAIKPGSHTVRAAIAAGTRVQRVSVILDKSGSLGVLRVGDEANPTRYFEKVDLTGRTVVSPNIEYRYDRADTLIVESINATGASGSVAVDFIIEC